MPETKDEKASAKADDDKGKATADAAEAKAKAEEAARAAADAAEEATAADVAASVGEGVFDPKAKVPSEDKDADIRQARVEGIQSPGIYRNQNPK